MNRRTRKIEKLYQDNKDNYPVYIFLDGTENIIIPRIKIERYLSGKSYRYEIFRTASDIMMPLEEWIIDFGLDKGLGKLSDSMCFTSAQKLLEKTRRRKHKSEEDLDKKKREIQNLSIKIKKLKKSNPFNLNQIKESYESESRIIS